MRGVYTDYFQKSKIFLYPLLKLKKGMTYVPKQTYLIWDNVYSIKDIKFICEYRFKNESKFTKFILDTFAGHILYDHLVQLSDDRCLVVFDFSSLKSDYNKIIKGQYSKLSLDNKITIIEFFDDKGTIHDCIQGFLTPGEVHERYAQKLGVRTELIETVYEVCSPPDLEKETIIDNNYIIYELLKKDSISLEE